MKIVLQTQDKLIINRDAFLLLLIGIQCSFVFLFLGAILIFKFGQTEINSYSLFYNYLGIFFVFISVVVILILLFSKISVIFTFDKNSNYLIIKQRAFFGYSNTKMIALNTIVSISIQYDKDKIGNFGQINLIQNSGNIVSISSQFSLYSRSIKDAKNAITHFLEIPIQKS